MSQRRNTKGAYQNIQQACMVLEVVRRVGIWTGRHGYSFDKRSITDIYAQS